MMRSLRCILFHFYIKPQRCATPQSKTTSCILFHFYIKPQHYFGDDNSILVVSYSISTSNHNELSMFSSFCELYLIPFLHQTTTSTLTSRLRSWLYLIPFLHQTTTFFASSAAASCCILFHFYIKPQLRNTAMFLSSRCILFHFYIKPQLNRCQTGSRIVVSYSISTSNHN